MIQLKKCPCGRDANPPTTYSAFRGEHAIVRCSDELCLHRVTVRGTVERAARAWNGMVDAIAAHDSGASSRTAAPA